MYRSMQMEQLLRSLTWSGRIAGGRVELVDSLSMRCMLSWFLDRAPRKSGQFVEAKSGWCEKLDCEPVNLIHPQMSMAHGFRFG